MRVMLTGVMGQKTGLRQGNSEQKFLHNAQKQLISLYNHHNRDLKKIYVKSGYPKYKNKIFY